jgi:hypothetical protein
MTTMNQTAPIPQTVPGQSAAGDAHPAATPPGSRLPGILFPGTEGNGALSAKEPEFFRDLNLDQIVETITKGREAYDLKPLFYTPLTRLDQIAFRHEIMRDLENEALYNSLKTFSERMLAARNHLSSEKELAYQYQRERAILSAAVVYCEGVSALRRELDSTGARSRGLLATRDYLIHYVETAGFKTLAEAAQTVQQGLDAVRYCVLVNETNVTVRNYEEETDYTAEVEEIFAQFKQGAVKDYRVGLPEFGTMNHIEAQILDFVAKLNPAAFAALDEFYAKQQNFIDATVLEFDRGIQFYLSYHEYLAGLKKGGMKFCYPAVSDTTKEVFSRNGFDLALASKLVAAGTPAVTNDYQLSGVERMMVITGPNQGGKTTFARAFGQLHYFASLGCPVAGTEARVFLVDRIFTHFDTEEDVATLQGKLKNELVRIHRVLDEATPRSLVILNEIFSSTTLEDAIFLGKDMLTRLSKLDVLGVCVTFLDELSSLNEKIVSMVATIVPENPTLRTFRIERIPANGLSYALALAEKYHLTYSSLKGRIHS